MRGREWIWGKVRILIVLLGSIAWLIGLPVLSDGKETGNLRETVRGFLLGRLGVGEPPGLEPEPGSGTTRETIYVLGGSQHSLKFKYGVVADIQKSGAGQRILVATVPGITEYARDLGRNLTNDEWTLRQLERLGVGREDIEFINLQNGFFGTLTEAKTLRALSIEGGIERLLLVCSGYHSRRVWVTFSRLLEGSGVEVEIHTADEKVGVYGLLVEYGKLLFYKYVLIPYEMWSPKRERMALWRLRWEGLQKTHTDRKKQNLSHAAAYAAASGFAPARPRKIGGRRIAERNHQTRQWRVAGLLSVKSRKVSLMEVRGYGRIAWQR